VWLRTDQGVFSAEKVDAGTELLLRLAGPPPAHGDLLDLGCGYGPIAVTLARRAPFVTRLVVCRPSDPSAFTGTVVLEWLNVSAGFDAPAHWILTHRQVVRAGWAWVGVSAQRAGIEGGSIFESTGTEPDEGRLTLPALKASDPARYGKLSHPGDAFSFDIFSQAARTARGVGDGDILGPLAAECVLASGQSQSAIHLVTYVNAVAPTVSPEAACDGYLIGSRAGTAASLAGWDGHIRTEGPDGVRIRPDRRAPVLTVQTETDITGVLAGVSARQPDDNSFRWWEIAGAAHADTYVLGGAGFSDSGDLPPAELARLTAPTDKPLGIACPAPVNSGLQHHYVAQAALAHLDRWARGGAPPPSAPRLETDPDEDQELLKQLVIFRDVVQKAAQEREPHRITNYLQQLATSVHGWYHHTRAVGAPEGPATEHARLLLARAARTVLANALAILGISAPDRM